MCFLHMLSNIGLNSFFGPLWWIGGQIQAKGTSLYVNNCFDFAIFDLFKIIGSIWKWTNNLLGLILSMEGLGNKFKISEKAIVALSSSSNITLSERSKM